MDGYRVTIQNQPPTYKDTLADCQDYVLQFAERKDVVEVAYGYIAADGVFEVADEVFTFIVEDREYA